MVLLYGKNGTGKTSTLDAIELAATGRIRRFAKFDSQAVTLSLINAQSPFMPATIKLTATNGQLQSGEVHIASGSNDTVRTLLSGREVAVFDSTSYLTQTEIRRIVTLDSASLGQLVRSLIGDEMIDTVIEALASANINRQNRTYQALKAQFRQYEEAVAKISTELETRERLFKSVQPAANALPGWTGDIRALASAMDLTIEAPKELATAEQVLRQVNDNIQSEFRAALSTKSTAEENIRLCEQLEVDQKTVDSLNEQLKSLDTIITASQQEIRRLESEISVQTEKVEVSRHRLNENDILRKLLDTVLTSNTLIKDDICPVCDRPFPNLKAHVEAKRSKLSATANQWTRDHQELEDVLRRLQKAEQTAGIQLFENTRQRDGVKQKLSSIEKTRQALLQRISTSQGDIAIVLKTEIERRDAAAARIDRLTELSKKAAELLGALSSAVIQQSDTLQSVETLRKRKSSQERQLEVARAKKEQLESFIDNVQNLRKNLEEHAEEILRAFTLVDAQRVFSDLFGRLARNPFFQVGFTEARVLNHKPRVDWKALRGDHTYHGELIFSQGELNASALSLFLALASICQNHLRVLILDDPIQSMDEVHIEELGEVLKAFKDELGWQILVSLHDEAAFKYFRRQLTPSAQGQSIISFTLDRSEGVIDVTPGEAKVFNEKIFELAAS